MPVSIKILKVFPLEEGLIFQCEYNPDAIHFTVGSPDAEAMSFAYLTLNGHPLNDLHPLVITAPAFTELICTKVLSLLTLNSLNLCMRARSFPA